MKFRIKFADQIVGLFILIGILGIVVVLIFLGLNQKWFTKKYYFITYFSSAGGLIKEMPILYKNIEIGKLHSFGLDFGKDSEESETQTRIEAVFYIYEDYIEKVVFEGSVIERAVSPIGLGSSLNFYPGINEKMVLWPEEGEEEYKEILSLDFKEGEKLVRDGLVQGKSKSDDIGTLISQIAPIIETLNDLAVNINELVVKFNDAIEGKTTENKLGEIITSVDRIIDGTDQGPIGGILDNVNESTDELEFMINTSLKKIMRNLEILSEELNKPGGLVTMINPQGSIQSLLDDDNEIYDKLISIIGEIEASVVDLQDLTTFVVDTTPQITGFLEEGRETLDSVQDVLEALKNNPLLKGGIPEEMEQQTTFEGQRDEEF